jgi:hypothetical protein
MRLTEDNMGLYNPILGDIPQPQKDSKEVAYNSISSSNYGAKVIVPYVNRLFVEVLETTHGDDGTRTDTYTTEEEIIITQITLTGCVHRSAGLASVNFDVWINEIKIASVNDHVYSGAANIHLNIPVEHCAVPKGSILKMQTIVSASGMGDFNTMFIGYYSTKQ